MTKVRKVSRRAFLKTTGLTGSALVLGVPSVFGDGVFPGPGPDGSFEPGVYISVDADGKVQLTVHRSEMGQGVRTSCAMILADELDVAWENVRVVQAIGHPKYGNQNTDGSRTIRTQWEPLRKAGAAVREMLVAAAAAAWNVPASDCDSQLGHVVHPASGRRLGYGALVERAATLPVPEDPRLKTPGEFNIIGRARAGVDVSDVVQGRAVYGWDVEVPGMLYASLERTPKVRGSVKGYDAEAARAVPGVRDVVEIEADTKGYFNAAIAVIADNTWAAIEGRKALNAEWESGPLPDENSDAYREELREIAARSGRVIREQGDVDAALAGAARVIEARYEGPYLVHAPMEPPACTASVAGDLCEVWVPTQAPQWVRGEIADMLGILPDNVTVNVTLLGGAFGRKSKPDFALEAAALSKKIGAPVKITWTREDEIRHGFYRAQNCQTLKASLDAEGRVTAWLHRTVFPSIGWSFDPSDLGPREGELGQGFTNMPYRVPNLRLEAGGIMSSLRIGWWRSVCNTFHAFAINSFVDELAHATERDPVEFHLEMLGAPRVLEITDRDRQNPYKFDTGRLSAVIERVSEMGLWGRELPARHGVGFAAHYSFLTYIAMVMHVSVDESGNLTVHEVDAAVDCGRIVNPDTIEAQVTGAVAFGLTAAKYGRITVKDGAVEQGDFHEYPILRIIEMPTVNVRITKSDAKPTGIGEPGVPPVAPALTNAIFAATGVRIRELPLSDQDLG